MFMPVSLTMCRLSCTGGMCFWGIGGGFGLWGCHERNMLRERGLSEEQWCDSRYDEGCKTEWPRRQRELPRGVAEPN